jgi:predicted nucleic acid-binding protein
VSYLLDTSALLAFYFGEPGAERVRDVLSGEHGPVSLSVLTAAEFWGRLRAEGAEGAFEGAWGQLTELVSELRPVTLAIVMRAIELRRASTARLPYVDALIAATATHHDAVLVHRDPHFGSIPDGLLRQEPLPDR